jgi:DNA-directed RNA polymerase subunit M/transcription elongation factor TFIIS
MGKWKISGCPRCGGSLFVDRDADGWYEQCINCSYRNELKALADSTKKPVTKGKTALNVAS